MMNIKMVTYEGDLTQFLVNTSSNDEAIQMAIQANKSDLLGPYEEEFLEDMEDPMCYTVDDIDDINILGEIIRRDDYVGNYNGTLIFMGA